MGGQGVSQGRRHSFLAGTQRLGQIQGCHSLGGTLDGWGECIRDNSRIRWFFFQADSLSLSWNYISSGPRLRGPITHHCTVCMLWQVKKMKLLSGLLLSLCPLSSSLFWKGLPYITRRVRNGWHSYSVEATPGSSRRGLPLDLRKLLQKLFQSPPGSTWGPLCCPGPCPLAPVLKGSTELMVIADDSL